MSTHAVVIFADAITSFGKLTERVYTHTKCWRVCGGWCETGGGGGLYVCEWGGGSCMCVCVGGGEFPYQIDAGMFDQ